MTTTTTAFDDFVELISNMMLSPDNFDMSVVQTLSEDFMQQNDLHFKDYREFIQEYDGDNNAEYWMHFKTTEEYFLEEINSMAITSGKIKAICEMVIACK